MSSLDDIKQMFFLECDELLEALNDGLTDIEASLTSGALDPEVINAVFRNVHSIKGGAASFGLDALVRFSHAFETVLDRMRSGTLTPDEASIRVLHRCADHLSDLVTAGRADESPDIAASGPLLDQLGVLNDIGAVPVAPEPEPEPDQQNDAAPEVPEDTGLSFAPLALGIDLAEPQDQESARRFEVVFTPTESLFATGHDPVHLFRELAALGDLSIKAETDLLPSLEDVTPNIPYLRWRLELEGEASEEDIREVFEFVDGLAELDLAASVANTPPQRENSSPISLGCDGDVIPMQSAPVDGATDPSPETSVHETPGKASDQPVAATKAPKSTVRVDLDLVDSLINIVGELVINQSVLTQSFSEANVANRADIGNSLDEYKSLALQIQDSVMSLRAQSVKQLFQRMARIVRETSAVAGKAVVFETDGEDTEIDKTVIERLIEPLTHILRNAIDHGLETGEDRERLGKPTRGVVRLSATHRSGRVLIEVTDDGAGINRARVFDIAVGKGIVNANAQLSDAEVDRLLFMPGFSTKEAVTDLSGRGVGMDVVRSAIQKLGGRISINSTPGRGTTLSISLPLTLAVLDGMVVDVAGQTMVVPITAVVETIRPTPEDLHHIGASTQVIKVRETLVPIVDLGVAFGYRRGAVPFTDLVLLLIETEQGERWALALDRIIDQRQVVIKSLEGNYGHVPGVAAATILGDGKIALIIDPEETARMAERDPAGLLELAVAGE
ncbi:two-component system, chemotaxis family, sensor kinase CheA [Roseivivax marinus]|uniref:chemotaxis protein CheA n=1 Tax=Roseivivax marinus TaxID=1379903 RepID=UPI0008AF6DC2|nr:chemotaxis protein CheA [Roseivivax marinus]SEK72267.1 two-component system, chemotaxis family, sensor kinase CheA [Roseivivax marinus]